MEDKRTPMSEINGYDVGTPPSREEMSPDSTGINIQAMKGLVKSSYSFAADPNTAALPPSERYPILNSLNRSVGGTFKGIANLDGGTAGQYVTSPTSGFLKTFDFMRTRLQANYRYLPMNKDVAQNVGTEDDPYYVGQELVDEMRKAIAEAVSLVDATTYTALAWNNYVLEAPKMVMGSAVQTDLTIGNGEDAQTVKVYSAKQDVTYGALLFYQWFIQSINRIFVQRNAHTLSFGTMLRSAWNRETSTLNTFFGLLQKSSFLSKFTGIGSDIPGEYVDRDWTYQLNMISTATSRRTDSLNDPVLEINTTLVSPGPIKLHIVSDSGTYISTVFDSTDFDHNQVGTETYTLEGLFSLLCDLFSITETMAWARNIGNGSTNARARFNTIDWALDAVQTLMTPFKLAFGDLRTVLDTMVRTGTVVWAKGYIPRITKANDAASLRNVTVEDIFRISASGPVDVTFNPETYRWQTFSLWNMYTGMSQYDVKNGGAFLTMSLRNINLPDDVSAKGSNCGFLPIALSKVGTIEAVARDGVKVAIDHTEVVMSSDAVLARLVPLPTQTNLKVKVPRLKNQSIIGTLTTTHKSFLYRTLTQIFGLGAVQLGSTGYDISLDTDILAIYQIEMEDITNEAISYARRHSPFRGTEDGGDLLGFFGTVGDDAADRS